MWDLSYPTRAKTPVPWIGRWILNHWTTREVLRLAFSPLKHSPIFLKIGLKIQQLIEFSVTVGKTEISVPSESFLSGAANFFCKGPDSKWFRLCWPCDISISMLLISNIKAAIDRKETDECSKTLHMNTDVHVSCTFHIAQNSFNFSQPFKNMKTLLNL